MNWLLKLLGYRVITAWMAADERTEPKQLAFIYDSKPTRKYSTDGNSWSGPGWIGILNSNLKWLDEPRQVKILVRGKKR